MYNTLISRGNDAELRKLISTIEHDLGCKLSIKVEHTTVEAIAWNTTMVPEKGIQRMHTPLFIKDVEDGERPLLDVLNAVKTAILKKFLSPDLPGIQYRRIYVRGDWEKQMEPIPTSILDSLGEIVLVNEFVDVTPPPDLEEWVLQRLPIDRPFRAMIKGFTREKKAHVAVAIGVELEIASAHFVRAKL